MVAERARDFPQKPVYLLGIGESVETRWSRFRYRGACATTALEFPCEVSDHPQT
jgi:hypothetical protein